jgi:hypothetical protein
MSRIPDPLPPLGDHRKRYTIELTEPEVNAIHRAFGFMSAIFEDKTFTSSPQGKVIQAFWDQTGPVVKALSLRLGLFDDEDAPAEPNGKQ